MWAAFLAMTQSTDYGPWLAYAYERLGGGEFQPGASQPLALRDTDQFPEFYAEMWHGLGSAAAQVTSTVFTELVTYRGQAAVGRGLDNLTAALSGVQAEEAVVTP